MMERVEESMGFLEGELESKIKEAVKPYYGMPLALSGGIDSSLLAVLVKPKFAISVELPYGDKYNEIKYSSKVAKQLGIEHRIVKLDNHNFEETVREAVKAIGRPIPHFNIFPFAEMCKELKKSGEKELLLGDGCDETMCGYTRDLIIGYIYKVYDFYAFKNYKPIIDKILPPPEVALARVLSKDPEEIKELPSFFDPKKTPSIAEVVLMRHDMDDMSDGIAKHWGIKLHRPYQDNVGLDNYMLNLPYNAKVDCDEYGKYLLRRIAEKYLSHDIAWRKTKIGGAVFNVNLFMGWDKTEGEFGKKKWLEWQQNILNE